MGDEAKIPWAVETAARCPDRQMVGWAVRTGVALCRYDASPPAQNLRCQMSAVHICSWAFVAGRVGLSLTSSDNWTHLQLLSRDRCVRVSGFETAQFAPAQLPYGRYLPLHLVVHCPSSTQGALLHLGHRMQIGRKWEHGLNVRPSEMVRPQFVSFAWP